MFNYALVIHYWLHHFAVVFIIISAFLIRMAEMCFMIALCMSNIKNRAELNCQRKGDFFHAGPQQELLISCMHKSLIHYDQTRQEAILGT